MKLSELVKIKIEENYKDNTSKETAFDDDNVIAYCRKYDDLFVIIKRTKSS